jgi:tetratricopeptide (TPR) repeat protein
MLVKSISRGARSAHSTASLARALCVAMLWCLPVGSPAAAQNLSEPDLGVGMLPNIFVKDCVVQGTPLHVDTCLANHPTANRPFPEGGIDRIRVLTNYNFQRYDQARAEVAAALKGDPSNADYWHLVARIDLTELLATGSPKALQGALRAIDAALKLNPNSAAALATNGAMLELQMKAPKALDAYTAALKIDPDFSYARLQRATLRTMFGDLDGAVDDLGGYLKVQPLNKTVLMQRAELGIKLKRFDQAHADISAVLAQGFTFDGIVKRLDVNMARQDLAAAATDLSLLIDGLPDGRRFALNAEQKASLLMKRSLLNAGTGQAEVATDDATRAFLDGNARLRLQIIFYLKKYTGRDIPISTAPSEHVLREIKACFQQATCRAGFPVRT